MIPHEFTKNPYNPSVCICGIPPLMHDLMVHLSADKKEEDE